MSRVRVVSFVLYGVVVLSASSYLYVGQDFQIHLPSVGLVKTPHRLTRPPELESYTSCGESELDFRRSE